MLLPFSYSHYHNLYNSVIPAKKQSFYWVKHLFFYSSGLGAFLLFVSSIIWHKRTMGNTSSQWGPQCCTSHIEIMKQI